MKDAWIKVLLGIFALVIGGESFVLTHRADCVVERAADRFLSLPSNE